MIPPGANPHTYEPTPQQLAKLSTADLYIKIGTAVEFELVWMDKLVALNSQMVVCDSSQGIELLAVTGHYRKSAVYHQGYDPHIWLSPLNAAVMVSNISSALSQFDSTNADFYRSNAQSYIQRLYQLHRQIKDMLLERKGEAFIVFHPAWAYFAAEYGLTEIPIENDAKEPNARQLLNLIKEAKERGIRTVFVSPQFNKKSAEVIAREIQAEVVILDPLGVPYIENILKAAKALVRN
jgi:zinc transport system substrate-binding protein